MNNCTDCNKKLGRIVSSCPSCIGTTFCWKCWMAHLAKKECAYSKAKTLNVSLNSKSW